MKCDRRFKRASAFDPNQASRLASRLVELWRGLFGPGEKALGSTPSEAVLRCMPSIIRRTHVP